MKSASLLALSLMTVQAASADVQLTPLKPADFTYRVTLRSPHLGEWPFLRFRLPHLLNGKLGRPDLGDLRVFNAAGRELPYSLIRTSADRPASTPVPAAWYPLPADATAADMQRLVQQGASATDAAGPSAAQSYLVDLSRAGHDGVYPVLDELVLTWDPTGRSFAASGSVDISNDLKSWHPWVYRDRIAQVNYQRQQIIENRVGMLGAHARYLRLKWQPDSAPPRLLSIGVTAWTIPADPIQYYGIWPRLVAAASTPGNFVFDAGRSVDVDEMYFNVLPSGTYVAATISVRDDPAQDWRQVAVGRFYRLTQDGISVGNNTLRLPGTVHARYWLLHTDPDSGRLPLQKYEFTLAWIPAQLVFRRQRPGPYVLAFGNPAVTDASIPLSQLLPTYDQDPVTALSRIPDTVFASENFTDQNEDPAVWSYTGPQAPDPPLKPIHITPMPVEVELRPWLDWTRWTLWAASTLALLAGWLRWRRRS